MRGLKTRARIAAWLYAAHGLAAPFAFLYVPNALIVRGDASATASHVRASESLLRLAIGGELWNAVVGIVAIVALYRLFKGVSERWSLLMMLLYLMSVPVLLVNVLNHVAALTLASGPGASSFDPRQLDGLIYFYLRLHGQGLFVAQIFWGLWLFPFGVVAMRSGFIPRALGAIVMIAGAGYVVASLTALLAPALTGRVYPFAMALGICELPVFLFMQIWGARVRPVPAAAPRVPAEASASA